MMQLDDFIPLIHVVERSTFPSPLMTTVTLLALCPVLSEKMICNAPKYSSTVIAFSKRFLAMKTIDIHLYRLHQDLLDFVIIDIFAQFLQRKS